MFVNTAKTAELIEMPFGMLSRVGLRNHVLDRSPDPRWEMAIFGVIRPIEKHCMSTLRCTLQQNKLEMRGRA